MRISVRPEKRTVIDRPYNLQFRISGFEMQESFDFAIGVSSPIRLYVQSPIEVEPRACRRFFNRQYSPIIPVSCSDCDVSLKYYGARYIVVRYMTIETRESAKPAQWRLK